MPVWSNTFTRAGRALLRGDTEAAEALAAEQLDVGQRIGQPDAELYFGVILFAVRLQQGGLAEIAELVEAAGTAEPVVDGTDALWGITACQIGRESEARQILDRIATDGFRHVPEHQAWSSILWAAAVIAVHLEDQERASQLYAILLPYEDHLVFQGLVVFDSVASTLGMLAASLGRDDIAAAHLARAAVLEATIDAPLLAARTRARQAGTLRLEAQ